MSLIISTGFYSNLSYQRHCLSPKEVNKLSVLSQTMYVLKRQNLKDYRLSPRTPFIALCLEKQIPVELKHSCSSLFLHYKHLRFLKCQEPRTIPEINIVSLYVISRSF